MHDLLVSYYPILIFMGLSAVITAALLVVPALVAPSNPDPEKNAPYECGFEAFDDARMKFDVKFYLVAILFIIFDLEVAFLFPWAVAFGDVGLFGFWSMMFFLAVLTVGWAFLSNRLPCLLSSTRGGRPLAGRPLPAEVDALTRRLTDAPTAAPSS